MATAAWATALPCPAAPQLTTAVPDASGRLWGWLASGIDFSVQIINAGSLAAGAYLAATQQSGDPNAAEAAAHSSSASAGGSIGSPHADSATPFANSGHRRSALGAWGPHLRGGDAAASRHARHQHQQQQPHKQAYDAGASMAFHTGHSSLVQPSELGRADQGSGSREVQQQSEPQVHHRHRRSLGQDTDPATSGYPSCSVYPAPSGVRQDSAGRLWSSEGGKSCVYRTSDGRSAAWFDVAPACAADPSDANIHSTDAQGRAWGWESGRSCAYRSTTTTTAASTSTAKAVASAASTSVTTVTAAATPSTPTIYSAGGSVSSAPSCGSAPTMGTSQPAGDMSAQPGYVPKVASAQAWYDAPRCSSPPDWSSAQPDSEGRLWGTEAGTGTCVFRDQRGYPLFYSDRMARSSCAYKDASGAAVYPPKSATR